MRIPSWHPSWPRPAKGLGLFWGSVASLGFRNSDYTTNSNTNTNNHNNHSLGFRNDNTINSITNTNNHNHHSNNNNNPNIMGFRPWGLVESLRSSGLESLVFRLLGSVFVGGAQGAGRGFS